MVDLIDVRRDIAGQVSGTFAEALRIARHEMLAPSTFTDDFALTSLDLLHTMLRLEGDFGIEFSDFELSAIRSVADVVTLIESKVNSRPREASFRAEDSENV